MPANATTTHTPLALQYQGISKSFFGVPVLKGVTFSLRAGHALGLVGENGAGKSTLMNILGGVLTPDGGGITVGGQAYAPKKPKDARARGIAFIHQELNLFANLSIAENIFLTGFPTKGLARLFAINRNEINERTRKLLTSVQLAAQPTAKVETLSPGERQLVEIAKALAFDARVVIFDEPTTSLTARECERLFSLIEKLKAEGRSVIYISHALQDVRRLCEDFLILRDGEVVAEGPREDFTLDHMVSLMVGRKLEQLFPLRNAAPQATPLLQVSGLSQPGVLENVGFRLHKGEVLGVAGLMGAGRSEMARILFGLDPAQRGDVVLDGKPFANRTPSACIARGMAFLTESRREEGLLMDADVRENVAMASLPRFARHGMIPQAQMLTKVEAAARSVGLAEAKIASGAAKTLSGGNQQKVVLAKWLLTDPSVLILDEPTRGIDVGAKAEIYTLINALVARGAGVLMISSELEELIGMCDRILVMRRGEVAGVVDKVHFDREAILRMAFGGDVS